MHQSRITSLKYLNTGDLNLKHVNQKKMRNEYKTNIKTGR